MAMASAQGIEEDADPALTLLELLGRVETRAVEVGRWVHARPVFRVPTLLGRVETRAVEVGRPRPCTSDWGDLTWAESV